MKFKVRLLSAYRIAPTYWAIVFSYCPSDQTDRTRILSGTVAIHDSSPLRSFHVLDTGHMLMESELCESVPHGLSEPREVEMSGNLIDFTNQIALGSLLASLLVQI